MYWKSHRLRPASEQNDAMYLREGCDSLRYIFDDPTLFIVVHGIRLLQEAYSQVGRIPRSFATLPSSSWSRVRKPSRLRIVISSSSMDRIDMNNSRGQILERSLAKRYIWTRLIKVALNRKMQEEVAL